MFFYWTIFFLQEYQYKEMFSENLLTTPTKKDTDYYALDHYTLEEIGYGLSLIIFINPSARAGYDTRPIFKWSLTGLNSEFSFS